MKNQEIDLSQNLTIHNSNVNKEEEIRYFENIGEILKREKINEIDILEIPIEIKAGEIIGLIGEYNINNEENEKCLHLEVIADDNLKRYVENITEEENVPQNLKWARIIDVESKDKISIFENLEVMYDNNIKEDIQINDMYKELFDLVDKDNNGKLEPYEIKQAVINKDIKEVSSKYIVKHSSEWDEKINMVDEIQKIIKKIDNNRFENKEEYIKILEIEKKRIKNLSLFEKCKEIEGFPQSDEVFHINAIGLVKAFKKCKITKEMLIAMGCIQASNDQALLDALNKYCEQYEINTCLRVAHFLAQAAHESGGFTKFEEGIYYQKIAARDQSEYRVYEKELEKLYPKDEDANRNNIYFPNNQKYAVQPELFNLVYANENGNGDVNSGDGYTFRGRGVIQITGRDNYKNYTLMHNSKNPNDIKDFENDETHRDEIKTNMEYAVESACWYWTTQGKTREYRNINTLADLGTTQDVLYAVSLSINGWYIKTSSEYLELSQNQKNIYNYLNSTFNIWMRESEGHSDRTIKFNTIKNYLGL
ncbi:chitinase-like protein [Arcobacter venerupis]|uniref:Chitinase-like protein n=1 Tax=Arcobacter venerupis TaxID=1054033 RepID=A0AAE7B7B3_9BACT|nr:hypothetical protein [Arcobacter venerupis]QKF66708.1 chitinase-like protein [Arcobacter venerupis]RWS49563.1 hypothetical protein CKA56_07515 [Arcobacter venerupis]